MMIYRIGFRLALVFWRTSEWLDKLPGFNDGFKEAYNRHVERNPFEDDSDD